MFYLIFLTSLFLECYPVKMLSCTKNPQLVTLPLTIIINFIPELNTLNTYDMRHSFADPFGSRLDNYIPCTTIRFKPTYSMIFSKITITKNFITINKFLELGIHSRLNPSSRSLGEIFAGSPFSASTFIYSLSCSNELVFLKLLLSLYLIAVAASSFSPNLL